VLYLIRKGRDSPRPLVILMCSLPRKKRVGATLVVARAEKREVFHALPLGEDRLRWERCCKAALPPSLREVGKISDFGRRECASYDGTLPLSASLTSPSRRGTSCLFRLAFPRGEGFVGDRKGRPYAVYYASATAQSCPKSSSIMAWTRSAISTVVFPSSASQGITSSRCS